MWCSAGYTDDTLAKVLMEATMYVPPGMSIQAAGRAGPHVASSQSNTCNAFASAQYPPRGSAIDTRGNLSTECSSVGQLLPGQQNLCSLSADYQPRLCTSSVVPLGSAMATGNIGVEGCEAQASGLHLFDAEPLIAPCKHVATSASPCIARTGGTSFSGANTSVGPRLPMMLDQKAMCQDGDTAFASFMSAFRHELQAARKRDVRIQKFVPSANSHMGNPSLAEARAEEVFAVRSAGELGESAIAGGPEAIDDFDEWPDEFLLLGVAAQDPQDAFSAHSTTSSTASDTVTTDATEESSDIRDDDDDAWAWPVEMLVA